MDNMYPLRQKISTGAPMIYGGNWEAEHKRGWRWVKNLRYDNDLSDAKEAVDEYTLAHGSGNVTLGHPFDENQLKPGPTIPGHCGLYVRDVEELAKELVRDLSDTDLVERWLHE